MPTEFELKYLMERTPAVQGEMQRLASHITHIEQGCLADAPGLTLRVRHATKDGVKSTWTTTLKVDVPGRVVEVEQVLSERDGRDLWACCTARLRKIRHHIVDDRGRWWEVDVFLVRDIATGEDTCYCVLAEIELPEGAPRPTDLPDFIRDHLLYEVPLGDSRFSNKKLWRVGHTNALYERVKEDSDDGAKAGR